ncbi:hypothetical protein CBL_02937 [Carabus blaptoides fortunei]
MDFSGLTYYELLLRGEQRKDLSLRQAKRLLSTLTGKPTVQLVLNSEGTEMDPHLEPLDCRIGHLRHRTLRIADEKLSAQAKTLLSAMDAMEEALAIKCTEVHGSSRPPIFFTTGILSLYAGTISSPLCQSGTT